MKGIKIGKDFAIEMIGQKVGIFPQSFPLSNHQKVKMIQKRSSIVGHKTAIACGHFSGILLGCLGRRNAAFARVEVVAGCVDVVGTGCGELLQSWIWLILQELLYHFNFLGKKHREKGAQQKCR